MKPTIVESQFLRAGSSKGSLNSHLLSKYRSCLEACFEEEELKEYVNKEHSFLLNNQREYSLEDSNRGDYRGKERGNEEKRDRNGNYNRNNDLSRASLPDWLTEGRCNSNSNDNIYDYDYDNYNNSYSSNNRNYNISSSQRDWSERDRSFSKRQHDNVDVLSQRNEFYHQPQSYFQRKSLSTDYGDNFNNFEGSRSREIGWLPSRAEKQKKYSDFQYFPGMKGVDSTYSKNGQWWQ